MYVGNHLHSGEIETFFRWTIKKIIVSKLKMKLKKIKYDNYIEHKDLSQDLCPHHYKKMFILTQI
jgi:hypothetical protein